MNWKRIPRIPEVASLKTLLRSRSRTGERVGWPAGQWASLVCFAFLFPAALAGAQEMSNGGAGGNAGLKLFENEIRPALIKHCYECHSASEAQEGGLALDTRAGVRQGGERGSAVVSGAPEKSLLMTAIRYHDANLEMPPDQKLPERTILAFEQWIRLGAPDPREGEAKSVDPEPAIDWETGRAHWAFQPVLDPEVPAISQTGWERNAIDSFILKRLTEKGLNPGADLDRQKLARRIYLDLIGLPPSPEQVEAFCQETSDDAIQRLVADLLKRPEFGEKWARHWLDVVRYAESTGGTVNFYYPQAWRYRDYVIAAFNKDTPFDQFVVQQLAGDLLEADDPNQRAENMVATGFLAMGPKILNERSGLKFELDVADEQIDVTTQAFLGVTVACARCHDHKFDPIPQSDYYALAGIFRSTESHYGTVRYINAQRATSLLELPEAADVSLAADPLSDRARDRIERQVDQARDSMRSNADGLQRFFTMGRIALLEAQLNGFEDDGTPRKLAMGVEDKSRRTRVRFGGRRFGDYTFDGSLSIGDSPIYVRGEHSQPTDAKVPRAGLQILAHSELEIPTGKSGRLELARWIACADNPLTARVIVNRVWMQLFGQGLVQTPNDFGLAAQPPTHPELLDHLATWFIQHDWSVKQLIGYIMASRVYQLSSSTEHPGFQQDPENQLYWRVEPRRLDAELLRDSMLQVSGRLEGEPPVGSLVGAAGEGPISRPFMRRDPILSELDSVSNRQRSIYLPWIRDHAPESMMLFDAADPSLISPQRAQTMVAPQTLYLLNNELVWKCAESLAGELDGTELKDQQVFMAFQRTLGRTPQSNESEQALEFLQSYSALLENEGVISERRRQRDSFIALCHSLLVSAEFQFRP